MDSETQAEVKILVLRDQFPDPVNGGKEAAWVPHRATGYRRKKCDGDCEGCCAVVFIGSGCGG